MGLLASIRRKKKPLRGRGHRVGSIVAGERREDRERLVRTSSHQVAGHMHTREVIAGKFAGFDEPGELSCRVHRLTDGRGTNPQLKRCCSGRLVVRSATNGKSIKNNTIGTN